LAKKVEDYLPKHKPKQTGRKGIGPKEDDHKPELLSEANKKRGKTSRLPGMEDPEIEELEDAAREYANIRDDRMKLTSSEVETKDVLLSLMKKHKKESYNHDGVEVKMVHEKETVKVRIKKEKE
jgi:hypothetical protein